MPPNKKKPLSVGNRARETFLLLPGKGNMLESRSKYPAQIFNDTGPYGIEIELLSITCEQSSHDKGNRNHSSSKKKMGVISYQRPCKTGSASVYKNLT